MNNYQSHQQLLFQKASSSIINGEEDHNSIRLLDPEYMARLRAFTKELPQEIAQRSIFGKAHWVQTRHNTPKRKSVTRSDL